MSVTAVPLRPVKKGSVLKLWIGLAVLALAGVAAAWIGTRGMNWQHTASGLQYQVIEEGQGARPGPQDVVTFDYVGTLPNGTEFDSSKERGPAQVPIFGVVPGFGEGLQLMNRGSTYLLRIPPKIGYGPQGQPPVIPPNTTIEFKVTLRDFRPLSRQEIERLQQMQQQMMQQQMMQGGAGGPGAPGGGEGPPPGAQEGAPQGQ